MRKIVYVDLTQGLGRVVGYLDSFNIVVVLHNKNFQEILDLGQCNM